MQKNQLTTLPESISSLTQLIELILSNNKLDSIPSSIGKLSDLRKLGLNANKITSIPESIGNLTQLQVLRLSINELKSIPKSIGNLKILKELRLSFNHLKTLPDEIMNLKRLHLFTLRRNNFTAFSIDIWKYFSVITPILSDNNFSFPEYKRIFIDISEEESVLNEYLDNLTLTIFSKERSDELHEVIESDGVIFQKAVLSSHQNWLGIGASLSRAIYGTLIGAGFLQIYDKLFSTVIQLEIFLGVLFILIGVFLLILWQVVKQEKRIQNRRAIFVHDSNKALTMDEDTFQPILKTKYFSTESDMKAARYDLLVGFTSNLIISSATSLIFTIFTSSPNVLTFILNPWEWNSHFWLLLTFITIIASFSIPILFYLFRKSIPNLGSEMRIELNFLVKSYKNSRTKILQTDRDRQDKFLLEKE